MRDASDLLTTLRQTTREAHQELENLTFSDKIMDGTLSAPEYRRLLDWQRRSHLLLEPRVAGFAEGDYAYRPRFAAPAAAPRSAASVADRSTALGILYVLEGSSLGGSVIHRKLLANPRLADEAPFTFYRSQAEWGLGQWRSFVALLSDLQLSASDQQRAAAGAREAFATFRREWAGLP